MPFFKNIKKRVARKMFVAGDTVVVPRMTRSYMDLVMPGLPARKWETATDPASAGSIYGTFVGIIAETGLLDKMGGNADVKMVVIDKDYPQWLADNGRKDDAASRLEYGMQNKDKQTEFHGRGGKFRDMHICGLSVCLDLKDGSEWPASVQPDKQLVSGIKSALAPVFGEENIFIAPYLVEQNTFTDNYAKIADIAETYFADGTVIRYGCLEKDDPDPHARILTLPVAIRGSLEDDEYGLDELVGKFGENWELRDAPELVDFFDEEMCGNCENCDEEGCPGRGCIKAGLDLEDAFYDFGCRLSGDIVVSMLSSTLVPQTNYEEFLDNAVDAYNDYVEINNYVREHIDAVKEDMLGQEVKKVGENY